MTPRERTRSWIATVRELVTLARREDVPFMAAAIAYYAFVSILPALLLALSLASAFGGEAVADRVLAATDEFLTPAGQDTLTGALTGDGGRSGATLFGVALLSWSALRVFRGLDRAFSRLYGTSEDSGFLNEVFDAAVVLGSIGLALWGMIVLGGVLAIVVPTGGDLLGLLALFVGLLVVLLPLFYVFPDADVRVRDVLPGAAIAAVGWVVLQAGFQVYAAAAPRFRLYGVIGGILLLVTWFYLAAMLLLFGGVVNVALGDNRQVQQGRPRE